MNKKAIKQIDIDRSNGYKICKNPNCHKANEKLTLDNFTLSKASNCYYTNCKKCTTNQKMEKYVHHPEVPILERDLAKGSKLCTKYLTEKTLDNFDKDTRFNIFITNCKECVKARKKRERQAPHRKKRRNEWLRDQRKNNPHFIEVLKQNKKRGYERKKHDPRFNLNRRIKGGIWLALKDKKAGRHWETIVNFTLDDLQKHLESLFTDGMNWTEFVNGKIEIDHVLPVELFEFKDDKDILFKICWSLDNLQPLWKEDNNSKLDRLPDGRYAKNLSSQEKLDYLISLGFAL